MAAILFIIPAVLVLIDFISFYTQGKRLMVPIVDFFSYAIFPMIYLMVQDAGQKNDCCDTSAVFSPAHRITAYTVIILCIFNYFYCLLRARIAPPLIEVTVNALLIIAVILNIFIAIQEENIILTGAGNVPIILLSIIMLGQNHQLLYEEGQVQPYNESSRFHRALQKILFAPAFIKYPILLVLCLPVLVILAAILLIFGQKPDSMIRMFTDTYKHGLSQLDHECAGVVCEGHYLCTVAAKGHKNIVKPVRLGKRGGKTIICNRQLLVSNAFEELIQQKFPILHRLIRKNYDKVGDLVEKHYHLFNNKFISDIIYLLMKPLEWMFLLVLYCCDRNPENRIARQYLPK